MRRFTVAAVVLFPAMIFGACASSGGASGGGLGYTRDFGRLLVPLLAEAQQKVYQKHNWNIYREEVEFQNIYWETEWRPFNVADAGPMAPSEARGRIIIRGRRVGGELDGGSVYRVTFVGEYEVRGGSTMDWRPAPMPEGTREVFERVAGDLALEVRTGVRR